MGPEIGNPKNTYRMNIKVFLATSLVFVYSLATYAANIELADGRIL